MAPKPHIARTNTLSVAEARRLAISAQGFGNKGPLLRTIKQIGLLQLDSVNVVVRSHYLPLFSRLGAYDTALLDVAKAAGVACDPVTGQPIRGTLAAVNRSGPRIGLPGLRR